jgi:hypothetical protein
MEPSQGTIMLMRWCKYLAVVGAGLWAGAGAMVIGSIALSIQDWLPNLSIGLVFVGFGWLFHLRANSFYRYC